ncbi:MAG TPA: cyclodeaminase/cyclohydrolase family protein [Mucilaginibacter sp.]|jgi:formiminotetrahydrofolate cyclodeaminase
MKKLIEYTTEELLQKFGSGEHKPGSGSAAAFQGLLSAQLIVTVITLSKRKPKYREWLQEYERMNSEIENRIYPQLLHFFQLDSEQFDRVIKLRRELKSETDVVKWRLIKQTLDDATLPATQTPIGIAKLCAELADCAVFLCDYGFQAARGDSGVALNNATATIAGCLSIINLNLLSLGHDEQTEQIRLDAERLKAIYDGLIVKAAESLSRLEKEAERMKRYHQRIQELDSGRWVKKKHSHSEIEELARRVQNTLWLYRDILGQKVTEENIIDLLKPDMVLTQILNYQYFELESLDQNIKDNDGFEIAGIIDKAKKSVAVSRQFPKETRNFTAAHELGHALLHEQTVLHRDKPIDGSGIGNTRDAVEIEADKFATYFLMPEKLVNDFFKQLFLTSKFVINENTVFSLMGGSLAAFKRTCKNLRDLSMILAAAESYNGQQFRSLADIFNVSQTTMAIRLEELGFVEF